MATATKSTKKKGAMRTKSAFADENFYAQMKAGGDGGWNEIYQDPKDAAKGMERFYLKYYGAAIASLELDDNKGEMRTKITIFGSAEKSPVPSDRDISPEEWKRLFTDVMEAIQGLYQV